MHHGVLAAEGDDVTPHRTRWSVVAGLAASFWFRVGLSLSVFGVLLTRVDALETAQALSAVDLRYFLASVAADLAARAVMVGRWAILLRASGETASNWSTARVFLISSFVGTALPAGGADVTRAYAMSRYGVSGSAAAVSVVVDRLLGIVALLTLGVAGVVLGMPEANLPLARRVAGLCLAAALLLFGAFWADSLASRVVPRTLRQASVGRWMILAASEMAAYRSRLDVLAAVFGLSLVVQWLRVTEVFLLGAGLGIDVSFGYYLVFMPLGLVVFMLPVSVAGVGLPQGAMMWLLRPAGVPEPLSFALSALVVVLGVLGTLPGLYLYLRARGDLA